MRSQFANWLWQSASPMHCTENELPSPRGTDSHVASLLGMTEVFYILPCLFPTGTLYTLETPQSASPTAPLKGAPRARRNHYANPKPLPRSAAPLRGSGASAPKGSPDFGLEQRRKENVQYTINNNATGTAQRPYPTIKFPPRRF